MSPKGATSWGTDMDDVAFVPRSTGSLRIFGQRHLRTITVQVADGPEIDGTQKAIEALLLARHRTADFQIRNTASNLDPAEPTQNTLTLLPGSLAHNTLLVRDRRVMNTKHLTLADNGKSV